MAQVVDEPAGRHRGELFAALAAMGFGSAYVATSFALEGFGPLPIVVWRSALAAVAVALVVAVRQWGRAPASSTRGASGPGDPPTLAPRMLRLLVIATFGGPLFLSAMSLAIDHVGATIAAFVAGLYAVLAAVFAPFLLPERLTGRVLAGFVLALVGTALLAELDPVGTDLPGIGWGIFAAVSFALYLVLARRWSRPYRLDGLAVGLANVTLTALVLGTAILVVDPASLAPSSPPLQSVLALVWLALVAALGPVLTVASVRRIPAARASAFLLLNPITATVLAAVLLGERVSPPQLAGALLVLVGMGAATIPAGPGLRRPIRSGVED
jgi:drug/metabolite transporter (DMT)-like permease